MFSSQTVEAMTSPTVQRKSRAVNRTLVACVACKDKKQKCDGQSPSCRNCVRAKRDCFVEDPTTKRRQPRAYVQSLEERIAMLERLLQAVNPEVARDHLGLSRATTGHDTSDDLTSIEKASPNSVDFFSGSDGREFAGQPSNVTHATNRRASEATPNSEYDIINDLQSEVGLLSISAAGREPHYFGPSSSFSFSRILSSGLGSVSSPHSIPSSYEADKQSYNTRSVCPPEPLPSRSMGAMLSETYFANIHPQYPFLHQPTFARWEDELMTANETGDLSQFNPSTNYFVFMVYAIASLIVPGNFESSAEGFYISAQQYIDRVMQLDNLETIQAILCCAMYSVRSAYGPSIWSLSGVALRLCVKLGYHRSFRRCDSGKDLLKAELAKRCFWVTYDLDRAAGVTLGRPFGIADKDIDVDYPLDIDDSMISADGIFGSPRTSTTTPSTTLSCAIHIYKMRQIWSKIHETMYPSRISHLGDSNNKVAVDFNLAESIRIELETWYKATPEQVNTGIGGRLSVFSSKEWFSIAYHHTIMLLYRRHLVAPSRNYGPGERSSIEQEAINSAFAACCNAAREICITYRHLYISRSVSYTWGSLHILFLAGLTYMHCLWSSESVRLSVRRDDVFTTCTACTMVLVIMAERWKAVVSYRDIFETLASRTITMMCDTERESLLLPGLSASRQPWITDQKAEQQSIQPPFREWIDSISDVGMCEGVQMLLSGFLPDGDLEGGEI